MSRNFLSRLEELHRGDSLVSNNGQWKAVFQEDGNFVIYGWKPVWTSDTEKTGATQLIMQDDCNLVMYTQQDKPCWQTNTHDSNCSRCRLQLTDDGKLIIQKKDATVWSSANSKGMK
ncbi:B-type lectin plumieribetin-like [Nothobranchius furzeri]|uniref:Mannose-specific lectin-like n=2 Tax=Nothobranchius TaxID=28779 RepID=A0A8C6LW57_NOTFU|nr:B-type lectin plumieribetin-like [Nothobranchius furzeri]KAF7213518.1 mannose-specific lectin-like [Nothobranchius furzeri]